MTIEVGLTSGGVELMPANAPGYRRAKAERDDFSEAVRGQVENLTALQFPMAVGSWPTVDGFAIFRSDDPNALFTGSLTASKSVDNGDTVAFAPGALRMDFNDTPSFLEVDTPFTLTIELNPELQWCPRCGMFAPAHRRCPRCGTIVKATIDSCATCQHFDRSRTIANQPRAIGRCTHRLRFSGGTVDETQGEGCDGFVHADALHRGQSLQLCQTCGGSGSVPVPHPVGFADGKCPDCDGTGEANITPRSMSRRCHDCANSSPAPYSAPGPILCRLDNLARDAAQAEDGCDQFVQNPQSPRICRTCDHWRRSSGSPIGTCVEPGRHAEATDQTETCDRWKLKRRP